MGVVVEAPQGMARWQTIHDGNRHGFEPTFRDFSAMVRVRARSGEKHRRGGAAPLENFKGQIHVFKRHFLSQNNMHSVHNQCIRSILIEICP